MTDIITKLKDESAVYENETAICFGDCPVIIKKTLSLTEMMGFVSYMYNSCFDKSGVLLPEVKDFAIRSGVVNFYSDIELFKLEAKEQYDVVYRTDVFNTILENINREQFGEAVRALDNKIEQYIKKSSGFSLDKLGKFGSAINSFLDVLSQTLSTVDYNELKNALMNDNRQNVSPIEYVTDADGGGTNGSD